MAAVLLRMAVVWQARWVKVWLALLTLGLGVAMQVEVVRVPGYELAEVLSLVTALALWPLGVRAGRFEAQTREKPALAVAGALCVMMLWGFAVSALALIVCLATTPCDPFVAASWLLWLVVPSMVVTAAASVWVGARSPRWRGALLWWVVLLLASAALTAWPLVFGPQVYAFNHFGGYLPGPLYDEALSFTAGVGWFRLTTLALAVAFAGALQVRWHRRWLMLLVGSFAFIGLELGATSLGFRMSDAVLAAELGGLQRSGAIELHFDQGLSSEDIALFMEDVEFRVSQVSQFLGGDPQPVRVWLYRSDAQKKRLVGAGDTQFSKPWRHEVHVNALGWPHPVIKHELVHALAARWGQGPFGVTSRWLGLYPNAGVIEGLAVAADNPVDELTLHEWAAAMKRQHWLPDVSVLMEPSGFYAAPGSRAYSTAGSFIRWLVETQGNDKMRALYGSGDFEAVYGLSLATLAHEYEAFLEKVPLDESAVNQAFRRFKGGSLFEAPCAREVANLEERIDEERQVRPLQALALNQRCRQIQPQSPDAAMTQVSLLRAMNRHDEALTVLNALLAEPDQAPSVQAEALLAVADLALRHGDEAVATQALDKTVALNGGPSLTRTALVRRAGFSLPPQGRAAVEFYFSSRHDDAAAVRLREALIAHPEEPVLAYLLGRRLVNSGDAEAGMPWLKRAVASDLDPLIRREAARLLTQAATQLRRCTEIPSGTEFGSTFEKRQTDWRERCAWLSAR